MKSPKEEMILAMEKVIRDTEEKQKQQLVLLKEKIENFKKEVSEWDTNSENQRHKMENFKLGLAELLCDINFIDMEEMIDLAKVEGYEQAIALM